MRFLFISTRRHDQQLDLVGVVIGCHRADGEFGDVAMILPGRGRLNKLTGAVMGHRIAVTYTNTEETIT